MNRVNTAPPFPVNTPRTFRWRLQLTIMGVVSAVTIIVLLFAQRRMEQTAEQALHREFQHTFDALRDVQDMRRAALVERCQGLVERLRLSSERDVRRKLYAHGVEVLGDVIERDGDPSSPGGKERPFHVEFVRFLGPSGELIPPDATQHVGSLSSDEQRQLQLPPPVRDEPQLGYLVRDKADDDGALFDIIALPVALTRDRHSLAMLVLGFEPANHNVPAPNPSPETLTGIWTQGRMFLLNLPPAEVQAVADEVTLSLSQQKVPVQPVPVMINGVAHLLLMQCLNVGSSYPPAYEVGVYSLEKLKAQQWRLRWQVLLAGGLVLLVGLGVSHLMAVRFARPIEQLVQVSAENRARRRDAEEALALTTEGLRRAARFSADASHQLKTPVAVLRSGLEELLAKERLSRSAQSEVDALIKQTGRLSGLIDDLLLLSRVDAGRLEIQFSVIDLVRLIEGALDDRSARPDPFDLRVEKELPAHLAIRGDARYVALLLENLVENAGKYNRPGGTIRVRAQRRGDEAEVMIANTTRAPIPLVEQGRLFDRFHRGTMGEDIPGYGLGLNLARELARLHRGDLELVRSDAEWTEFAVRFVAVELG